MNSRGCDVNQIHDTTSTNSRCYRHALTIGHAVACLAGNGAQRRVGGQFGEIGRVYALGCINKVTAFVNAASRQRKSHVLMTKCDVPVIVSHGISCHYSNRFL